MSFSLYMPCSKSLPHSNLIHMSKTLHFVFPYYTIFPIEKQESIPQKNNRKAIQALLLSFLFLKINLPAFVNKKLSRLANKKRASCDKKFRAANRDLRLS